MPSPIDVIDYNDTGDEVLRRFRFQLAYVVLKTIALVDDSSMGTCLYCEQVEDFLTGLKDGRFIGTQIKTREIGLPPLKASDDAIFAALVKFCQEDVRFPGSFAGFCLATNHAFYRGDGADDIRKLIACAKDASAFNALPPRSSIRQMFHKLATHAKVQLDQVIAAFAKLDLDEMLTGVDLDVRAVQALAELDGFQNYRHLDLLRAGRFMMERVLAASSKANLQTQVVAQAITLNIAERTCALTVADKRLGAELIAECMVAVTASTATQEQELLAINGYLHRNGEASGLSKMEAKMSAGEMTVMDVEQFKDDVRSLELAFLRWTEKFDLKQANKRLQHLQQLVMQQCRQTHNSALAPEDFRHPIVTDIEILRRRMFEVARQEATNLFGCRADHLNGAVGMLTEECRVWWSEPFPLTTPL